jgi:predicted ribosomally synthesized peptide with nif11-like leader
MASETDGLAAFLEHVAQNPELQDAVAGADFAEVCAIASQEGFALSRVSLLRAQAQQILSMSDEELELLLDGDVDELVALKEFDAYLNRM